jgi:hypothetical protein
MRDKPTPQKLTTVIIVLLVALTGLTGFALSRQPKSDTKKDSQTNAEQSQTKSKKNEQKPEATTPEPISYTGQEGKTALELLTQKATVITKDSAYGPYVDTINGVQGGTDGKYWAFYVNDELAQVGADAYQTKSGDKIEWKFE